MVEGAIHLANIASVANLTIKLKSKNLKAEFSAFLFCKDTFYMANLLLFFSRLYFVSPLKEEAI